MCGLIRQLGHAGGKVKDRISAINGMAKYMHSQYGVNCFHLRIYDSPEIVRMGNYLLPDGVSSTDVFVWHQI
jgi:hypothetical protein